MRNTIFDKYRFSTYLVLLLFSVLWIVQPVFKGQELLFYISNENGVSSEWVYGLKDSIKLDYFTYYLVKDIPAKLDLPDESKTITIRAWDQYTYSLNTTSLLTWGLSIIPGTNVAENALRFDGDGTGLTPEFKTTLYVNQVSFPVRAYTSIPKAGYKFRDYTHAVEEGLLTSDFPVAFVTEQAFLSYYTTYYGREANDISELIYDGVVVKLPYTHSMNYWEYEQFKNLFSEHGYTVVEESSNQNDSDMTLRFMCIGIVVGIALIDIIASCIKYRRWNI